MSITRHHMRTQQRHNLTVGHLIIVKRVYLVQQRLYLTLLLQNAHTDDQVAELSLIHNAIHVKVKSFVVLVEFVQEFFVLSELEVKNHLFEIFVHQLLANMYTCSFDS